MKHYKKTLMYVVALLCLYNTNLNAQEIKLINPGNINASASEIEALLGNRMDIQTSKIIEFYYELWDSPSQYDDQCSHPDASITEMDNNIVAFEWNDLTSSSDYFVSYISLTDGTEYLNNATTENTIEFTAPNDLYLFAFQSQCTNGQKSDAFIIIIEKPVSFKGDANPCSCTNTLNEIWSGDFSNLNSSSAYTWTANDQAPDEGDERKYTITLEYTDDASNHWFDASFDAKILFNDDTPQQIYVRKKCIINANPNDDYTLMAIHNADDESEILGTLAFAIDSDNINLPAFYYSPSNISAAEYTGTVKLFRCRPRAGGREQSLQNVTNNLTKNIKLIEVSNSFNLDKTIEYTLPGDDQVSIDLYDSFGRHIKQIQQQQFTNAGIHQLHLNLADLAQGTYFFILKTPKETLNLKLLNLKLLNLK